MPHSYNKKKIHGHGHGWFGKSYNLPKTNFGDLVLLKKKEKRIILDYKSGHY
jgi:hypothetical protein